jgi:hypothetical protein
MRPKLSSLRDPGFSVFELTPACWSGQRTFSVWVPIAEAHRESFGPVHSVTLQFGSPELGGDWHRVTSTGPPGLEARGLTGLAEPSVQSESEEDRSRSAIHQILFFTYAALQAAQDRSGDPDDAFELARDARLERARVPVDGEPVEFVLATVDGAYAATSTLRDGTVTVSGVGRPDRIALQAVRNIELYLQSTPG